MDFLPAPERPRLPAGEVHVWRLERDPRQPRAWREVLARYLDERAEAIDLTEGAHGKPRLAQEPPSLHFNLSHSGAFALIAVSRDREVGVDVERIEPERDFVALADRALSPQDAAAVREATEDARAGVFYERWTRHEARLKCLGLGLGTPPPRDVPPVTVETLAVSPAYAAAVAASGTSPLGLRCWTFGLPLSGAG